MTYGFVVMALSAGIVMPLSRTGVSPIPVLSDVKQCEAQEAYPVTLHRDEVYRQTTYRVSEGDCAVEWIARDVEPAVIKHRSLCSFSIGLQLPLIKTLFEEFLRSNPNSQDFRTLFWGRIEPDDPDGSWEMAFRIALAAYKSPGWDARRGKPKNGDINGFVKDLANQAMIYPELKNLFEGFNRTIRFSCAEKVLVAKAGKLPFYDALKFHGVNAEDKLPFDCMTWFSISTIIT